MHLAKNLSALAKNYPHYAERIKNTPVTGRFAVRPSGMAGFPNLFDMQRGTAYYSNVSPITGVENEIKAKKIKMPNLAIVLGFGLGYHMLVYINMAGGKVDRLIVFEKDWELLRTAMETVDISHILGNANLTCCFGDEPVSFYSDLYRSLISNNAKMYMTAMNIIETPSITSNMQFHTECIRTLKDAIQGVMNLYGNDPQDSLIGIRNTFHNINTIIDNPGIKDLKDAFKNKPGIVVASGPSLDKNISLLHEIGDKAVISAADASLRIMLKHGLKPHFITSLERVIATAKLFEGVTPEEAEGIYFAACPVVMPETYAEYPGKKVIVMRPFSTFEWLDIEKGVIDTGPSAGNMSFNLLRYLGCNPIILIGQDLAFAKDKTHAEGGVYGSDQTYLPYTKQTLFTEGNYEAEVKTTQVWYAFKKAYEKDIAAFSGRVINATEGGARVYGTELMTLREVIDAFIKKPLNVLQIIDKKLRPPFPAQQEKDRLAARRKVTEGIAYCESLIQRMKTASDGANAAIEKYYKPYLAGDMSYTGQLKQALIDFNKYNSMFSERAFYLILMHYVQSYFIKSVMDINAIRASEEDSPDLDAKLLAKGVVFFITLMNLTEVMKKELNDMLGILDEQIKLKS